MSLIFRVDGETGAGEAQAGDKDKDAKQGKHFEPPLRNLVRFLFTSSPHLTPCFLNL